MTLTTDQQTTIQRIVTLQGGESFVKFAVKHGETQITSYADLRKAKACRWAVESAVGAGVDPVFALLLGLIAAEDADIVASYSDDPDYARDQPIS